MLSLRDTVNNGSNQRGRRVRAWSRRAWFLPAWLGGVLRDHDSLIAHYSRVYHPFLRRVKFYKREAIEHRPSQSSVSVRLSGDHVIEE